MNIKTHILTLAALIGLTVNAQYSYVTQPTWTYGRPELVQAYSGDGRCVSLRDRGINQYTSNQFIDVRYWNIPEVTGNPRHAQGSEYAGNTYIWSIQPGYVIIGKVGSPFVTYYPFHLYGTTQWDTIILEFPTCNALVTVGGLGGSYWCDHAVLLPAGGLYSGTVSFEGAFDADEDFRFRPCRMSQVQQ